MIEKQRDPPLVVEPSAEPIAADVKALIEAVCGVYTLRKAQTFWATEVDFGKSR